MKTPPIHVRFDEGMEDGVPVRRMTLEGLRLPGHERIDVWWRFPDHSALPSLDVVDALVGGHVLMASKLGEDLVVHGAMSRGGLRNLHRLLEIRMALTPGTYKPISIEPDRVAEFNGPSRGRGQVVAAMSGGLDSTFTVVRHAKRWAGERSHAIDALVLVLGFDIPRRRADRFAVLRERMSGLAASLGLPLFAVETNGIDHTFGTWPQTAMPLFGGVLAQCAGRGGTGLVSAGSPYGTAHLAYSHTPPLDALTSGDDFTLITDGGGFSRADKIEALKQCPEFLASLRVCWQGQDPTRNCGVCEKCVMTRLSFLAAGITNPPCFDSPLSMDHLASMPLSSVTQARDFFRFSLAELNARGVRGPEGDYFRKRMTRVPPDHLAPMVWSFVQRMRSLKSAFRRGPR